MLLLNSNHYTYRNRYLNDDYSEPYKLEVFEYFRLFLYNFQKYIP
jgi:hypothetical protein